MRLRRGGRRTPHVGTFRSRERAELRAELAREWAELGLDPCDVDLADRLLALDGPDPVLPLLVVASAIGTAE